ncbi:lysophospholipase L1-like esterase [Nocardioides albertanoniae]|uniref:Lysophospholipase L1-like esterase n=1 Tax=Nocardioides albertanoniae TaxID=1175486 RepID=A0A543ACK9_9ACTN|nr:SGNH/GDSL hydrolase family protein [Nocardioides albertanoniae]TQL70319.1 lysophospholipase L1-like esterase [Nocardioides albertanoniae]
MKAPVRRIARATIVSALAGAVLATVLAACSSEDVESLPGQDASKGGVVTQDMCSRFAAESVSRAAVVTGAGEQVVVIGDSWAAGYGLDDPAKSWPAYLDGQVRVSGFAGTGYARSSMERCGPISFGERAADAVRQGADLVVLEGGINDAHRELPEAEKGFRQTLDALKGHDVVVLGAPSISTRAAAIKVVNKMLKRVSKEYGVTYINVFDLKLPYQDDHTHLTPAGHVQFGRIVAQRIAESRSEPVPAHG